MRLPGKVAVVTGAASGIGLALATRFVTEGATVIASDLNAELGVQRAGDIGARFVAANVARKEEVANLVRDVLDREGRLDLFCSNAGVAVDGGVDAPNKGWQLSYDVNVMAHVYAARHALPHMLSRGEGYLLSTASAAGLLTEVHSAPYAVSKHAALAFAEWLSVTYQEQGIRVSCLCPEGVWTPMIENALSLQQTAIQPEEVADMVVQALDEERFLITTHPTTLPAFQLRAQDHEGWLARMRAHRERALAMQEPPE